MPETRGKKRPPPAVPVKIGPLIDLTTEEVVGSTSEFQATRLQLRRRWELASVLNFFKVFRQLIHGEVKVSAEDIEAALISPNDVLAQLHIALLKGIPPVNKNLAEKDAWVTITCKKLAGWWRWLAEGDNPLKAKQGTEIMRYTEELDAVARLLILKALCELRLEQDDAVRYITDALKDSSNMTNFCKEKIGNADSGVTYWCDGDPILGHRLYKETVNADSINKSMGKAHVKKSIPDFQWETLATNLEEFHTILETMSSSKVKGEVRIAQTIKNDFLPVLEEIRKKKERALKKQQREALLLGGFLHSNRVGLRCSQRERRTVNYSFDEYDRAINEAIEISKSRPNESQKEDSRCVKGSLHLNDEKSEQDAADRVTLEDNNDSKEGSTAVRGNAVDDSGEMDYFQDTLDVDQDASGNEGDPVQKHSNSGSGNDQKVFNHLAGLKLRRSGRLTKDTYKNPVDAYNGEAAGNAGMKLRLKVRPTPNVGINRNISVESEADCVDDVSLHSQAEIISDSEEDPTTSSEDSDR